MRSVMEGFRVVLGKHIALKIQFGNNFIFGCHASMKGINLCTLFFPG